MARLTPLETIATLIEARRSHDMPAAFDCYATDALVILRPGERGVGEAAIKAFIAAVGDLNLAFEKHDVLEHGDIALHTSRYMLDLGDAGRISGRTADVLRRNVDGAWRIVIDNAFAE
ncbi:nuclear transport factor 2 family protein [Rhizobium lusitanum]|uniref:YybH family protein n=1 Tax=Rhizobium lusitanum TaxID=293958 RepID=UPI00195A9FF8|nr:nuclear transport factor 2 family protein [Rhizobium lusitanum]MBM7044685.1 nuclear transport factor 2 family protein [Rhizobium lusitanum]